MDPRGSQLFPLCAGVAKTCLEYLRMESVAPEGGGWHLSYLFQWTLVALAWKDWLVLQEQGPAGESGWTSAPCD